MDDLKLVIVSRDGTVSVQASAERNVHAESVERNVAMNGHVHHPAMGRSSSDLVRRPVPRPGYRGAGGACRGRRFLTPINAAGTARGFTSAR